MKLTRRHVDEVNGHLFVDFDSDARPTVSGPMVMLIDIPPRKALGRLTLRVTLHEHQQKDHTMRCNFTTELKVDIDATDDKLRKAFIDLITAKAREVFGVAGMLAKGTPVIHAFVVDRDGREDIPLFEAAAQDVEDDD